jgi:hypothetical protein
LDVSFTMESSRTVKETVKVSWILSRVILSAGFGIWVLW